MTSTIELIEAIDRLDHDSVAQLLADGADANTIDDDGYSLLYRSVKQEVAYTKSLLSGRGICAAPPARVTRLLLEHGANAEFGRASARRLAEKLHPIAYHLIIANGTP